MMGNFFKMLFIFVNVFLSINYPPSRSSQFVDYDILVALV